MKQGALSAAYQESSRCNRCGFCQSSCPVYQVTRKESSTARGHHYQVCSLFEGALPAGTDLRRPLGECLLCRACISHCAPKVQTDEAVAAARHALLKPHSSGLAPLLRHLTGNPRRLRRYARLLAVLQSVGAGRAAAAGGRRVFHANALLPRLPAQSLLEDLGARVIEADTPRGRIGYFAGCGINHLLPKAGRATISQLVSAGFTVQLVENYCCGLPLYSTGDLAAARRLAAENVRLFLNLDTDAIVTDCASCSSFLKGYADLLHSDSDTGRLASDLAGKVVDITEFMVRHGVAAGASRPPITVTYHDPCHAIRYQSLRDEPRQILKSVTGVKLIEMEEADWCCGGAGAYAAVNPDLSVRILERKIENAARTGADAIVSSCPSCLLQLSYGVHRAGLDMKVLHLSEVLGTGLQ